MYGKRQTEYQKRVMKERMSGSNNPMYGKVSPNKGKKMSDEQKKKISIALSGRKIDESKILRGEKHWAYGKHFSEEHRKNLSNSRKGKHLSDETKKKLSNTLKGKTPWNKGIKMSEQQTINMRKPKINGVSDSMKQVYKNNSQKQIQKLFKINKNLLLVREVVK